MTRAYQITLTVSLFCILFVFGLTTLRAEALFGITDANELLVIDSLNGMVLSNTGISGLGANESLVGIDIRPATGELYGYSSSDQFYKINPANGATLAVGGALALIDSIQSFDFDPVTDQIRLVTSWRKNFRINPNTGAVISTDGQLTYAGGDVHDGISPVVVHAAYTNSFPGAANTTLFNLEAGQNVLTMQTPENTGTLNTVGPVGVDLGILSAVNGMDISGATGIGYVVGSTPIGNGLTANTLYTINLATGEIQESNAIQNQAPAPLAFADNLDGGWNSGGSDCHDGSGWIGGGSGWNGGGGNCDPGNDFGMVVDVAAPVGVPEPSTFVLAGCGAIGVVVMARRRVARRR